MSFCNTSPRGIQMHDRPTYSPQSFHQMFPSNAMKSSSIHSFSSLSILSALLVELSIILNLVVVPVISILSILLVLIIILA